MRNINRTQRLWLTEIVNAWAGTFGATAPPPVDYAKLGVPRETLEALLRRGLVTRPDARGCGVPTALGIHAVRSGSSV